MRVACYGGSFNPPAHHVIIAQRLLEHFERVQVTPCGARKDKASVGATASEHRRAMATLAFGELGERVQLDFSDLDQGVFTPSYQLVQRAGPDEELWLVVGADLIQGGGLGQSPIQREWQRGMWLWENARFVVTEREDYPICKQDLPPTNLVIGPPLSGASKDIRRRVRQGQSITGLVPRSVETYIDRNRSQLFQDQG